jgi:hypothetical protein
MDPWSVLIYLQGIIEKNRYTIYALGPFFFFLVFCFFYMALGIIKDLKSQK